MLWEKFTLVGNWGVGVGWVVEDNQVGLSHIIPTPTQKASVRMYYDGQDYPYKSCLCTFRSLLHPSVFILVHRYGEITE